MQASKSVRVSMCTCLAARFSDICRRKHLAEDKREDKVIEKRWDEGMRCRKHLKKEREDKTTSTRSLTNYMGGFTSRPGQILSIYGCYLAILFPSESSLSSIFSLQNILARNVKINPIKMQISIYDFPSRRRPRSWKTLPAAT